MIQKIKIHKNFVAVAALLVILGGCVPAFSSDKVDVWRDPSYDFSGLHKIFVLPVSSKLNSSRSSSVVPQKQLTADMASWVVSGVQDAMKKKSLIVKPFDALLKDMNFIYGALPFNSSTFASASAEAKVDFFKKAADMGFQTMLQIEVSQSMEIEHIPESRYTHTVYKDVEIRDSKGKVKETIRVPEEKVEISPAYDEEYLYTHCLTKMFDVADPDGDHVAAVDYSIYREYQGGPVMKVVENVLKASMKRLLAPAGKK